MKPRLVAIAGGSASGKTWLAQRLVEQLGTLATRVSLDDFYRDRTHLTLAERKKINFDHPRAIDWALFGSVLEQIREGRPCPVPRYDFVESNREPEPRLLNPVPLVLVDGLWPLVSAGLSTQYDLKVFVDCPPTERLARRLARDTVERAWPAEVVTRQFWEQVEPMHQRFVEPQRAVADEILDSPITVTTLQRLADRLKKLSSEGAQT